MSHSPTCPSCRAPTQMHTLPGNHGYDANRVLRRAESEVPPVPRPGETVEDAAARGARQAQAAQAVLRYWIRLFRDEGKLDLLIEAAHRTDNVEGLLRSGELTPKELAEIAKKDQSIFRGAM